MRRLNNSASSIEKSLELCQDFVSQVFLLVSWRAGKSVGSSEWVVDRRKPNRSRFSRVRGFWGLFGWTSMAGNRISSVDLRLSPFRIPLRRLSTAPVHPGANLAEIDKFCGKARLTDAGCKA